MVFTGWRRSTRSGAQGNCVEVATSIDRRYVAVRDSKLPAGRMLVCTAAEWSVFLAAAAGTSSPEPAG